MTTPLAFFAASQDLVLPFSMLVVFGSAKLLAEIAEHFRVPGIVGGLLAGVLIGPSVLNLIQINELLHALAELGVMFLLFLVGLHIRASDLIKVGRTAMLVAVIGVAVPFVFGWAILSAAGHSRIESIFMGTAMVATSVGITAQVLASKGLLSHHTSRVILAAAVIDDVLGLLVLAVVSSFGRAQGVDYLGLLITSVASAAFIVVVVRFGTPTANLVMPHLLRRLRSQEGEFAVGVSFLFFMALLATFSGVAAIIGAFLAGIALAETVGKRTITLVQGAGELMIPFFLASIGLQLELSVFRDTSTIALGVVIVIAAIVSKGIGCGLGAFRLGRKDALRVGVGMVPRGEVGMVVAQIGLNMGTIGREVYGVAVFMAVATTILTPPLLAAVYRDVQAELEPAGDVPEDDTLSEPTHLG